MKKKEKIKIKPSIEKYIDYSDKVSFWVILLILVIVPLIFTQYCYATYSLPKTFFIYFMTIILIALWVVRAFLSKEVRLLSFKIYLPLILLLISFIISVLLSINIGRSFFGAYKRYEGLLTLLCYLVIFFIVSSFYLKKKQILYLIWASVFTAVFISIYGIVQYFGGDFLLFKTIPKYSQSISSIGNAKLLAGYLALMLILSVFLFLSQIDSSKSPSYISFLTFLPIIILFLCLLFTTSMSGYIAFMVGFILLLIFILKNPHLSGILKKWVVLILIVFIALSIITQSLIIPHGNRGIKITPKIDKSFIEERAQIWVSSFVLLYESLSKPSKFIFGYGPETFGLIIPKYLTDKYIEIESKNPTWSMIDIDRPRNEFIYLFSSIGIFGLAIYLFFLAFFFTKFLSYLKKLENKPTYLLMTALFSLFIGYQVYLIFSFSVIYISIFFWIFLGLALMRGETKTENEPKVFALPSFLTKKSSLWLACPIIGAISLYLLWLVSKAFVADIYFEKSVTLFETGKTPEKAIKPVEMATALNPLIDMYYIYQGWIYSSHSEEVFLPGEKDSFLKKSKESFLRAKKLCPEDTDNLNNLAKYYLTIGKFKEGFSELNEALKNNPYDYNTHMILGAAYFKNNEIDSAIKEWNTAIKLRPYFADLYFLLGQAYQQKGDKTNAINNYKTYLSAKPQDKESVKKAQEAIKNLSQ